MKLDGVACLEKQGLRRRSMWWWQNSSKTDLAWYLQLFHKNYYYPTETNQAPPNPNITSPSFFQKPLMVPEKNLGYTVTISFRNSEEKTNFLSEVKFTHLQSVRLSRSKSTVALAEFPQELVASHPAAIWTRMPFYLTTPLFCHEEWLNHWWQWFHARNNNSWEHHPILATAESSLDLKLS